MFAPNVLALSAIGTTTGSEIDPLGHVFLRQIEKEFSFDDSRIVDDDCGVSHLTSAPGCDRATTQGRVRDDAPLSAL